MCFAGAPVTPGTMFYFVKKILTEGDIAHGGSNVYKLIDPTPGNMQELNKWGVDYQENAYNVTITPCIIGLLYYRGKKFYHFYNFSFLL